MKSLATAEGDAASMIYDKTLNLAVDMYGCPNRCLHCWLGHMPNRRMDDDADQFVMDYFGPYFDKIAFYSWVREPDYCAGYKQRWQRDIAISKNAVPERFELAGFYRIVRDDDYIPFLRSVGVKKVQLTFFGLQQTQDMYIGRRGAFDEVMRANDKLIAGGILPRWQCFINEDNKEEIVQIYKLAMQIRESRCAGLEFFVHEGSCEGENRKLYPIRIEKNHIPAELIPSFLDYNNVRTESECCDLLRKDNTAPSFPIGEEITLFVANNYDVYYNYTHMTKPWVIGNLKTDAPETLVQNILTGNTPALQVAQRCRWTELAALYGDGNSQKVFRPDDYKMYLLNTHLEHIAE